MNGVELAACALPKSGVLLGVPAVAGPPNNGALAPVMPPPPLPNGLEAAGAAAPDAPNRDGADVGAAPIIGFVAAPNRLGFGCPNDEDGWVDDAEAPKLGTTVVDAAPNNEEAVVVD